MKRKIGIVGGGVGGLVTALLLSKDERYDITVYEQKDHFGGRLQFVEHEGYKVDEGPTIVLLPEMLLSILEEGGLTRDEIPLVACDPLYSVDYTNGEQMLKFRDIEKQKEEIERLFPGDGEGFERFIQDMKWRFHMGQQHFLEQQFVKKRQFFTPKNIQMLVKLRAYQHVKRMMKSYFKSEQLQNTYALQTLYIGGHPGESPALYSLVSYSEHEHGIWYLKGGYASLVDILLQKLSERGVTLQANSSVEHIGVQHNHCDGIVVNGEWKSFDDVVLNGDFPIMDNLLPKEKKLNRTYTPSSGCFLVYMGLDRNYDQPSIHKFIMSNDFDQHMSDVFQHKKLPDDPSIYTFHPSLVDDSLAPEGKGVLYTLVPVPSGEEYDWDLYKESFTEKILDLLEARGYQDLRKHIEWIKVKTPQESMREGLFGGGSFGIAPTLFQSGVFRPQLKPYEVDNVYAVGASIHPGGGVPIVMQGAKLLSDYLKDHHMVYYNVSEVVEG
ncbi:capsular biosynthesis protein CpsH [Pontibacillus chungwhensis BH030062]|uniref:Capsular biosynthesis protein CpsH n=1 Tax=Pontibacillus chungwhensis BH030062 TaxID=1385513 RepID=A0A0A2VEN8_9BACI|nr:phytoene desaturase family protein [Pontibacillus chungwhensis]KGP92115.1 capsular biosynthesis protein CpsH [Pontibacillus chungwhensis BH030062]